MVPNKYNKYVEEIKSVLSDVLNEEESLGDLGDIEVGQMEGETEPFSPVGAGAPEPGGMGEPMAAPGEGGGLEFAGTEEGGGENPLSGADEELLDKLEFAASDSAKGEKKDTEIKNLESELKKSGVSLEGEKEKSTPKSGVVKENKNKNSKKSNKKTIEEKTNVYSDIRHVPTGRVSKNKNDREWEEIISKIIDSVTVVADETLEKYKELKKENEELREEVGRLRESIYQVLGAVKNTLKESAVYIAKNEYIISVLSDKNVSQEERAVFVESINESKTVEEAKRYYAHYKRLSENLRAKRAEAKQENVSPQRLNNVEREKIHSYLRKRAESQDSSSGRVVLGESFSESISLERLRELAGVKQFEDID